MKSLGLLDLQVSKYLLNIYLVFGTKVELYFVCYGREFVRTVIVKTEFDCMSQYHMERGSVFFN